MYKLFLIFIAVLVVDGLILPALFGLRESFLSLLILIVPILYMGSTKQSISYGFAFAFVSESLRGLDLGTLAIPFLATAIVIYLIQRFLDTRNMYALTVLMSVVFTYVFLLFYGYGSVHTEYFKPVIGLTVTLESIILVFLFSVVFDKKYVSNKARIQNFSK